MIGLASSAYLRDIPVDLPIPNGDILSCFVSGDEFYNRFHDENGYTIVQSAEDGYYYYAKKNNDRIIPSSYRADKSLPFGSDIKPGVRISTEEYRSRKKEYWNDIIKRDAPTIGTINNINISLRILSRVFYQRNLLYKTRGRIPHWKKCNLFTIYWL